MGSAAKTVPDVKSRLASQAAAERLAASRREMLILEILSVVAELVVY